MCGICGVRRFGKTPIHEDQISTLLVANQNRGNHATGLALQQADGSIQVVKRDVPAWNFVASDEYKEFIKANLKPDTITFLGHTRLATVGDPRDNKNNHPMFAGKTAVVHNGGISNHTWMFGDLKAKRSCETDSDIIRAILDEQGFHRKTFHTLSKLSGSGAFAAVSTDFPGKLLLGRSGNPLELAANDSDHLIFSSERSPIYQANRPYEKRFGLWMRRARADLSFMPMNNDSAYLIGSKPVSGTEDWQGDWLEWHTELRIAYQGWTGHCYKVNENYRSSRTKYYGDSQVAVVKCLNEDCLEFIPVNDTMMKNLKAYKCKKCGTRLEETVKA